MPGIKTDGLPAEVVEYIEGLETTNGDLTTQLTKSTDTIAALTEAQVEETTEPVEEADDDLAKAMANPAVVAMIAKAQGEASEAVAIAKAERDARLTNEFIAKSATLPALPGKTDAKFGPLLKSAAEKLDSTEFNLLWDTLAAANGVLAANSRIEGEIGKSGAVFSGSDLSAKAAEIAKADPTIDPLVALAKAAIANPDLVAAHTAGGK